MAIAIYLVDKFSIKCRANTSEDRALSANTLFFMVDLMTSSLAPILPDKENWEKNKAVKWTEAIEPKLK